MERGTATLLALVRRLCKFARRYDFKRLLQNVTGNGDMGNAVELLILACDAFQMLDPTPGERGVGE